MSSNFASDIATFCERTKQDINKVHRLLCLELCQSLVYKSPVGNPDIWLSLHPSVDISGKGKTKFGHTRKAKGPVGYVGGRFRANWQIGVGSANLTVLDVPDPGGADAISRAEGALLNVKVGGLIFITNALPYASALEYGHSMQAPAGMVRITVQEYVQSLERALAAVKDG